MAWKEGMILPEIFFVFFLVFNVVFLCIAFLTPYNRVTKVAILIHSVSATLNLILILQGYLGD